MTITVLYIHLTNINMINYLLQLYVQQIIIPVTYFRYNMFITSKY